MNEPLSLRVGDPEDLAVVASVLQDAVVSIGDMKYMAADDLFVMVASRFKWENATEGEGGSELYERVLCGVAFEGVKNVQTRNIDLRDRSQFLDLLTVQADDGALIILFAGGGAVRLEVERLNCHMRDMGEPWPTTNRPEHGVVEEG